MDKCDDIQGKAKILARAYYKTHSGTYLDEEDLAQEAILAHLQGRSMKYGIIDAFRDAAPLSNYHFKNKVPVPVFVDIDGTEPQYEDNAVELCQLREVISQLKTQQKDVMIRHFIYGETFVEIGKVYGVSPQRIFQIKEKAVQNCRRKLKT
jgi:RNA polymerase sigma factor (sigma-70 family)